MAEDMASPASTSPPKPWWMIEAPYFLMVALALIGVAWASIDPPATFLYWRILVPVFAGICIYAGWRRAVDRRVRFRLVWTQLLHWAAILIAIEVLFFPGVQRMLNSDAVGLAIIALIALGSILAGIHAMSWRIAVTGALMAVGVPVIAYLEQSALVIALAAFGILATGAALFFLHRVAPEPQL
jgi:hypothetical protein